MSDTWIRELVDDHPKYSIDEILSMSEMPDGMIHRFNKAQKRSRMNLMTAKFAFDAIKYIALMKKVLDGHFPDAEYNFIAQILSESIRKRRMRSGESMTRIVMRDIDDGNILSIEFDRHSYTTKHTWEGFRLGGKDAVTIRVGLSLNTTHNRQTIPLVDRSEFTDGKVWNGVISRCKCCKETHVPMRNCSQCYTNSCSHHSYPYLADTNWRKQRVFICENCLKANPPKVETYVILGADNDLMIKKSEAPSWLLKRCDEALQQ